MAKIFNLQQKLEFLSHCGHVRRSFKKMALTKFEYVKSFEVEDRLEPLQWSVIRLQLFDPEEFLTSNSLTLLEQKRLRDLIIASCDHVIRGIREITLAYSYNQVVNFVLPKDLILYRRRAFKLLSYTSSLFASHFSVEWKNFFSEISLLKVPIFEGSVHLLPHDQCLRDFLTTEQRRCHEGNLEQSVFFHLVHTAKWDSSEALRKARNSTESEKNELLFSLCNINYNNEPPKDKKGTIFLRKHRTNGIDRSHLKRESNQIEQCHFDFVKNEFWECHFPSDDRTKVNASSIDFNSFKRKFRILPHCWLVVRIDGKGFHKFSELHKFAKPNDHRALNLMSDAAKNVIVRFPTIILAYGQSDEYSFVIKRYGHREMEGYSLISRLVTVFTGSFVRLWTKHFQDQELLSSPSFDARFVLYPTNSSLRDYLSWRQVDCHINNMYNTCFWNLIRLKGHTRREAQEYLKGTFSKDKLTILSEQCCIEYSEELPLYRKGTTIITLRDPPTDGTIAPLSILHDDLIGDQFWLERSWLLGTELKATNE